jgi:hypothetical protein
MNQSFRSPSFLSLCLGVVLTLGLLHTAPGESLAGDAKEPAAILTMVNGDVTITRGGKTLKGTFGATLLAGDVVETGAKSEASMFFESGQIYELSPGDRITVKAKPAQDLSGNLIAQASDAASGGLDRFANTSSGEEGLAALPTLRSGSNEDTPNPITPRNSLITPEETSFEWTPVEDVLEYRITLSAGDNKISHGTEATQWAPSDREFRPGERWGWSVEAVTMDGSINSEQVAFEVASKEQVTELTRLEKDIKVLLDSEEPTQIDTATYLLASYCRSAGFFNRAITHMETLIERNPDRKELHAELGFLYKAIGRYEKAAEEYQLALKE